MILEFVGGSRDGATIEVPWEIAQEGVFNACTIQPIENDWPDPNFSEEGWQIRTEVYRQSEPGKLLFEGYRK